MVMKLLFKPFSFTDKNTRYFTNLLSGETGSGKSSLIMQLLYSLLNNKNTVMPFKRVYINIDGFDFDYFNNLAKSKGLDVTFHWLDMHELFSFAKRERELYQEYSTDGQGTIAKRIRSNINEEYIKYFTSLIICDEADNYLGTDLDKEVKKMSLGFSNFMKFKRHHSIELWLLTQKFQNLNSTFYNNGAINRFIRVRSMFFTMGKTKILQHWSSSDTSKKDNLLDSYWYEVEEDLYNRYDVGANISTGDGVKKKFKFYLLALSIALLFSSYIGYKILGKYIEDDSTPDIKKKIITSIKNPTTVLTKSSIVKNVVKCISFLPEPLIKHNLKIQRSATANCYYKNNFASVPIGFIKGLMKNKLSDIEVIYAHKDVTFFSINDTGLKFIFQTIKRGKNEED